MMGILFAGCNKEIEPDRGVAQKITDIWITAETDGKALPSNEKIVFDIVSPGRIPQTPCVGFASELPNRGRQSSICTVYFKYGPFCG